MRSFLRSIKNKIGLVGAIVIATVVGAFSSAVVMAVIPDSNGVIHACYTTGVLGKVRIIDSPSQSCNDLETAITWSQTGPQGPQGPAGPGGLGSTGLMTTNLVNADLSDANLPYRNFSSYNFTNSNLENTIFTGSDMKTAVLQSVIFRNTRISLVDFSGNNLSNVKFLYDGGRLPALLKELSSSVQTLQIRHLMVEI